VTREERLIDQLAYPAKLPTNVKRILAAKFAAVWKDNPEPKRQVTATEIPLSQLSKAEAKRIRDYKRLQKRHAKVQSDYYAAQTALYKTYASVDDKSVSLKVTDEDKQRADENYRRAFTKYRADRDAEIEALKLVVVDLAQAQIEKTKKKLPPQLVERLDAIGSSKLLVGHVAKDGVSEGEIVG
jgi:hypothetical protein